MPVSPVGPRKRGIGAQPVSPLGPAGAGIGAHTPKPGRPAGAGIGAARRSARSYWRIGYAGSSPITVYHSRTSHRLTKPFRT